MNVVCLEDDAFYELIDKVVDHIKLKEGVKGDNWVDEIEAMKRLNIKSKTTLQEFRDEDSIRLNQPQKKIILYNNDSINDFLKN